jgi:hypothetical protein
MILYNVQYMYICSQCTAGTIERRLELCVHQRGNAATSHPCTRNMLVPGTPRHDVLVLFWSPLLNYIIRVPGTLDAVLLVLFHSSGFLRMIH